MISRGALAARALLARRVSGRAADVTPARWLVRLSFTGAALAALSVAPRAAAQGTTPAAPAPAAAPAASALPVSDGAPARRLLVVTVEPGGSGLEPAVVRAAIARELGVEVLEAPGEGALGVLTVRFDDLDGLEMTFEEAGAGRTVQRSLRLPPDRDRRLEAVALLAGNVARDEAGELVAALYAAEEARRIAAERDAAARAAAEQAAAEQAAAEQARREQAEAAGASPVLLGGEEPSSPAAALGRAERIAEEVDRAVEAALAADLPALELDPIQLGVVPGVALYPDATERRFHAVFTLLYGRQGAVSGLAGSVFAQRTLGVTRGVTGAGIWQRTGPVVGVAGAGIGQIGDGPLRGVEGAGILNLRSGAVQGAEVAGILNRASAVVGVQSAGLVNLVGGDLLGVQSAGLVNVVEGELMGAQAAGLVNVARGPASGLMVAGLGNGARAFDGVAIAGLGSWAGDVDGAEIAGVANVARDVEGAQIGVVNVARDVEGAQIGVVNVARRATGAQIGVVNISREIDGAPLGLVNVTRGSPRLVVWHEHAIESDPQNLVAGVDVAIKTLIGPVYTQFGLGGDAVARTWDATTGLGLHLDVSPVYFEVDALYRGDWDVRASNENDAQAVHYRGKVGVEILHDALAVFAGGGLRQAIERDWDPSYSATALAGFEVY